MCKYSISEVDYEWRCPHEALPDSALCIFHLEDEKKDKKQFLDALNKVLKNSEKAIHFDGFNFPPGASEFKERRSEQAVFFIDAKINGPVDFGKAEFTGEVSFQGATFTKAANFEGATFQRGAGFAEATFTEKANFAMVEFQRGAGFAEATFIGEADFEGATFNERASFEGATFNERASFEGATFTKGANFTWTDFTKWSNFIGASFNEKANFIWTTFRERTNFIWTTFSEDVNFNEASFLKESNFIWTVFAKAAYFECTRFNEDANFHEATFTEVAEFSGSRFNEDANFHEATFIKKANFEGTAFNKKANFEKATFNEKALFSAVTVNGEINFRNVTLESPRLITFRGGTDLKEALFEGTDLRKIDFVDVRWKHTGSLQRRILLKEETAPGEKKDLKKLEQMYREIRQNYEAKRNYTEAGHFYVSEVEMRRKQKDPAGRVISMTAMHRYLSYYGENHWMPLLYFIILVSGSALMYSYLGLVAYGQRGGIHLSQHFIYSIQAATFQRSDYLSQYTVLGDFILTMESVLGPLFLIICAIALLRKFKR